QRQAAQVLCARGRERADRRRRRQGERDAGADRGHAPRSAGPARGTARGAQARAARLPGEPDLQADRADVVSARGGHSHPDPTSTRSQNMSMQSRSHLTGALLVTAWILLSGSAHAAETKAGEGRGIPVEKLPAAVQATVREQTKNAVIHNI